MSKLKFLVILALLLGAVTTMVLIKKSHIAQAAQLSTANEDNQKSTLNVGGLAWIEPKSRVIKLGVPNVLEGSRVEEMHIKEGDVVKKGQVLGIFSTYSKNKASLEVAESNLDLAKADLTRVKAGNKKADISAQDQSVQSLRANEQSAIKEFQRLDKLYSEQIASKSQFDVAKANMDRAVAERRSSEETLSSLKSVRPDDVVIAEAKVSVATSEVAVAKASLDLSTIVAPIDGTILTVYARNGESVGDLGILDMADLDVIDAVTEVDENDILKIEKGQRAEVKITGLDIAVAGTVREIGGQIKRNSLLDSADPSKMLDTRVFEVRIELNKEQNNLVSRLTNKKARAVIFTSK
jgi:HlyD family secretion protein